MDGAAIGELGDLFAATEAICNNDCFLFGGFDGRHQDAVGERGGNGVFLLLKTEGTGHAAAAGIEQFDLSAGCAE